MTCKTPWESHDLPQVTDIMLKETGYYAADSNIHIPSQWCPLQAVQRMTSVLFQMTHVYIFLHWYFGNFNGVNHFILNRNLYPRVTQHCMLCIDFNSTVTKIMKIFIISSVAVNVFGPPRDTRVTVTSNHLPRPHRESHAITSPEITRCHIYYLPWVGDRPPAAFAALCLLAEN